MRFVVPGSARYAYVYGVALQSVGRADDALQVLASAHSLHPADTDLLIALATMQRDHGDLDVAIDYARKLVELAPHDQEARRLLAQLQALLR